MAVERSSTSGFIAVSSPLFLASASLVTSGHFLKSNSSSHGSFSLPCSLYQAPKSSNVMVLLNTPSCACGISLNTAATASTMTPSHDDDEATPSTSRLVAKFRTVARKERRNRQSSRRVKPPSPSLSNVSKAMASFSLFPPPQRRERPFVVVCNINKERERKERREKKEERRKKREGKWSVLTTGEKKKRRKVGKVEEKKKKRTNTLTRC